MGELKKPKSPFEIKWPLAQLGKALGWGIRAYLIFRILDILVVSLVFSSFHYLKSKSISREKRKSVNLLAFNLLQAQKCVKCLYWLFLTFKPVKAKNLVYTKGQLISKGLFGILNSSEKQTKRFDLTTMIPQVKLILIARLKIIKNWIEFLNSSLNFYNPKSV